MVSALYKNNIQNSGITSNSLLSAGQKVRKLNQYFNQQMRLIKYDKTQFVTGVKSCLFRHRGAILRESSRTKECKSNTCWTCIRLWDSPYALQELKEVNRLSRSIESPESGQQFEIFIRNKLCSGGGGGGARLRTQNTTRAGGIDKLDAL
jgi:hypothetical protein